MATTSLNVDFWDVMGANNKRFEFMDFMRAAKELKHKQRLKKRSAEHSDYLEVLNLTKHTGFGVAARLRMTGLPRRFDVQSGIRNPLGLTENEALEEAVYFYFDEGVQTLATQRSRQFRSSSLEDLLSEIHGGPLSLNMRLRKDPLQRLNRMSRIASIEIKLLAGTYNPMTSDTVPSVTRFIREQQENANAQSIEVNLSVGRSRIQSLTPGYVRKMVNSMRSTNIERLIVTGNDEDSGHRESIDFLRDRLVFSTKVEYSGRSLEPEQCLLQLQIAIDRHKDYLKTQL